jgi:hypothetical protein
MFELGFEKIDGRTVSLREYLLRRSISLMERQYRRTEYNISRGEKSLNPPTPYKQNGRRFQLLQLRTSLDKALQELQEIVRRQEYFTAKQAERLVGRRLEVRLGIKTNYGTVEPGSHAKVTSLAQSEHGYELVVEVFSRSLSGAEAFRGLPFDRLSFYRHFRQCKTPNLHL